MKYLHLLIFASLISFACSNNEKSDSIRIKKNINRAWQFTLSSETDDFSKETKNTNWENVGLPHTFALPYFRSESFYVGYGWYKKELQIEEEWLNQNISLEFDGVFQVAEIFLNGKKVAEHKGGYTGFTLDITEYAKAGENNLAVRVNNIWDAQLAPRAGEHVFNGGIYRDVYLTVTNPVHVAWNGTFVTTPEVSKEKANVAIETEIHNSGTENSTVKLKTIIVNNEGNSVAEMNSETNVEAGKTVFINQTSEDISTPKLWSPKSPNLYRAITEVYQNDRLIDTYESTFGFRWLKWTTDKGFFLNGEHVYLEGVNVHQDHAGWGDAVTKAGVYRDLKLMKDAGFNLIRGSHYPHHPYFTEVCDQLGLLFLPENCIWGIGGFGDDGDWKSSAYPIHKEDMKGYEASVAKTLTELIRINRNSPSVMAWSMSNEPFFTDNSVVDKMKELLKKSVKLSHKLDPTRLAMIGGAQRKKMDILGDITGYNGDGATLYRSPTLPSLVSEYGSCVADRPGEYTPCWGHVVEGEKPEWRSGHAIWCGFDHGSIAGNLGEMGIVDFARIPKRSWYWYRNYFRGIEPPEWPKEGVAKSLKLFADKTTLQGTDATDDAHINVQVLDENGMHISNSPNVTLTIISGPGEFPTGRSITFQKTTRNNIQILDGHAAIEFRSYEGGTTLIEATSEGLTPAQIEIKTIGEPQYQEGVTPIVKDRPYVDYRLLKAKKEGKPVKVSDLRPIRTNSKNKSLPSRANDSRPWTAWDIKSDGEDVWWELDMENFYNVDQVTLSLKEAPNLNLVVETSINQKDWKLVAQGNYKPTDAPDLEYKVEDTTEVRFLRVTFISKKSKQLISVKEIEVYGNTN